MYEIIIYILKTKKIEKEVKEEFCHNLKCFCNTSTFFKAYTIFIQVID